MGGLGNQLYQYAMYEKLNKMGIEARLDFHDYSDDAGENKEWRKLELTKFQNLDLKECTKEERTKLLDNSMATIDRVRRKLTGRKTKEYKEHISFDEEMLSKIKAGEDLYLYGFWECDKYYEDMSFDFKFPEGKNPLNVETIKKMEEENSISLHIRRTDYLTVADGKRYTGICTEKYYKAALDYICSKISNPEIYIFSDDTDYAKKTFTDKNMHVVDWNQGNDSLFDMELMSHCKYNITANSTFSFWGAKLNKFDKKIMIRPLHHDNYEETSPDKIKDFWKNWVLIDGTGRVY